MTNTVTTPVTLLLAQPALAATPGWRGSGLTSLQVLGIFVGIPLAMFVVITLLFVLLPSWAGETRHRPGPGSTVEPAWFAGPADGQRSVEVAEPSQDGGGASASW